MKSTRFMIWNFHEGQLSLKFWNLIPLLKSSHLNETLNFQLFSKKKFPANLGAKMSFYNSIVKKYIKILPRLEKWEASFFFKKKKEKGKPSFLLHIYIKHRFKQAKQKTSKFIGGLSKISGYGVNIVKFKKKCFVHILTKNLSYVLTFATKL